MKDILQFIIEALDSDKCMLGVQDNHFFIKFHGQITKIDPKFKFVLVLANHYTHKLKSSKLQYDKENVLEKSFHRDRKWHLPEVIFATSKDLLENIIDEINDDDNFYTYSHGHFSDKHIKDIQNFGKQNINLHSTHTVSDFY